MILRNQLLKRAGDEQFQLAAVLVTPTSGGSLRSNTRYDAVSHNLEAFSNNPMIGRLLGHADIGSTARYAHLARDTEKVSAAKVGGSIEADIMAQSDSR